MLAMQFAICEETLQFRLAVFGRVGGVNYVSHFIQPKVTTDGAFVGDGGVGRADHVAHSGDGVLAAHGDCNHGRGLHKSLNLREKRLVGQV